MNCPPGGRGKMSSEEFRNERLVRFVEKTGYPLIQKNGQRVFGPPPRWRGPRPGRGCEIFVGKIPRFILEDELVPLFERCGRIYQLRLMMDFTGENRGYAFVTYTEIQGAIRAINELNDYSIRSWRQIGVYKSLDNCRLFVGGVPQDRSQVEVWNKLEEYVLGIVDVIMYPPCEDKGLFNRGYVFVEFCDHRSAATARRELGSGVSFWESRISVDWADPVPDVDPEEMARVKKLYIRNLDIGISNHLLSQLLCRYVPPHMICKVHKVRDYAFVHFYCRDHAEYALKNLQGAILCGKKIEVTWARPRIYSKANRMNGPPDNFCTSVPPKMRRVIQQRRLQRQMGSEASTSQLPSSTYSTESSSVYEREENCKGTFSTSSQSASRVHNPADLVWHMEAAPSTLASLPPYNRLEAFWQSNLEHQGRSEAVLASQSALSAGRPLATFWQRKRQQQVTPSTSKSSSPGDDFFESWHGKEQQQSEKFQPMPSACCESGWPAYNPMNIHINEPFLNVVNINMLPECSANSLPSWLSKFEE